MARCQPRERTSRCVAPPPGMMPIFGSGLPSLTPCAARMMSPHSASSRPPPSAWPLSAITIGFGKSEEDGPDFADLVADHILGRARGEHPDVGAGGEHLARPGNDDDAAVAVGARRMQSGDERGAHLEPQRVPGRRIVKDQPPHMLSRPLLPEFSLYRQITPPRRTPRLHGPPIEIF